MQSISLAPSAGRLPARLEALWAAIARFARANDGFDQQQIRGISRTITEIHWLLISLVLVYTLSGALGEVAWPEISAGLVAYAAFVMGFRYARPLRRDTREKIAVETWVMLGFITWSVWHSGKLESALLNTYLLVVVTASLSLGRLCTLLEVALIAACHVLLAGSPSELSLPVLGALMPKLAPVLLIAYVAGLFSAEVRAGLNRARTLSETDALTGLLNSRGFATAVGPLVAQAERSQRAASVLMIDSDNLKQANDRYGHEAGDRLLKQLAQTICRELRSADVPARLGGDEFAVFLPDTTAQGAALAAERIRRETAEMRLEGVPGELACSVSIGMATFPADGVNLEALKRNADRALYEAKRRGRNRAVAYPELRGAPRVELRSAA